MLLQPRNWAKFQHYKDRCPPWIKLHRDLLIDREFMCLPLASKALAPLLWLLASESKDGTFDGSTEELAFRLHLPPTDIEKGLKPLIDKGFFIVDSTMLAERKQVAIPETETEKEEEKEAEREKTRRGTRLDPDCLLSFGWHHFCTQTRPDLVPREVFDSFKDYWIAQPGQKGVKTDWDATWRNWVRRQQAPKKNAVEERRNQMAELTRGLSVPKAKPFWSKAEPTEVVENVESKRLL